MKQQGKGCYGSTLPVLQRERQCVSTGDTTTCTASRYCCIIPQCVNMYHTMHTTIVWCWIRCFAHFLYVTWIWLFIVFLVIHADATHYRIAKETHLSGKVQKGTGRYARPSSIQTFLLSGKLSDSRRRHGQAYTAHLVACSVLCRSRTRCETAH